MLILNQRNSIITCGLLLCLIVPLTAYGEIIFQENFDNDADWHQLSNRDSCTNQNCPHPAPGNWTYYNNDELWHPNEYPNKHATGNINNVNHRGLSGKAYTHWQESSDGKSGDGWGNDGMLIKYLGRDYKELYIQFYIKFDPGYQWAYTQNQGSGFKLFRAYHWDRTSPVTAYGPDVNGENAPIYFFDLGQNYYGWRHMHFFRCAPTVSDYYCDNSPTGEYDFGDFYKGDPSFKQHLGDGKWHKLSWHLKMNSTPGSTDGIMEFWADDILEAARYNLQYVTSRGKMVGWNIIAIGGNVHNKYSDPSNKSEQWYSIDDLIVSTIPTNSQEDTPNIQIESVLFNNDN